MDTYPEKVCALPYELFGPLLDSMLFGISHADQFVSKSCLRGISGLFSEHLKSQAMSGHLSHHIDILDQCSSRLLKEVIFQPLIWDRLEPAGMALLPLVAVDVNRFAALVNSISQPQSIGSVEKQHRLQAAFQSLLQPEIISKMANGSTGGFEGRKNRLKFKRDFELFVKDVHSFLVMK
eukprot:CAMPEP_0195537666 /NCGR_PEP_ID=MMETSP0794_2-20130614/48367_1 /TAXON_ID=515487 /ORGANISM="Stephanopyxis turris, Strain CCMP 815" /LENGTH=178 /DNA_ID=CAMNT_0040671433 /DNA_START=60 /DNA_END=596 /DNA_ORIENTATION=+